MNQLVGNAIPPEYVAAIQKGFEDSVRTQSLAASSALESLPSLPEFVRASAGCVDTFGRPAGPFGGDGHVLARRKRFAVSYLQQFCPNIWSIHSNAACSRQNAGPAAAQVNKGPLTGSPIEGVRMIVTDGKSHDVDSSEMAFRTASTLAFKQGVNKAGGILMEPMMTIAVQVPSEFQGNVVGEMNKRKGMITSTETANDMTGVVRESNSGHPLLLPPANWCPMFASRTTHSGRGRGSAQRHVWVCERLEVDDAGQG